MQSQHGVIADVRYGALSGHISDIARLPETGHKQTLPQPLLRLRIAIFDPRCCFVDLREQTTFINSKIFKR